MILPHADLTEPPTLRFEERASIRLPGGTRSSPVQETLARVRPLFDQLGVDHYRIDANEDLGACVYWACERLKFARGYPQQEWNFGGKGATDELALASVMMESLERVYGSRLHHPELVRARWSDVADVAIPPERLTIADGASFDPTRLQEWGWCRSLTSGQARLVHANFLLTPYRAVVGDTLFSTDFNGLASGNDLEEAALHALYELVERDAFVLFHHHRPRRLAPIDPDSIEDETCRRVLASLARRGVDVLLLDVGASDVAHTLGVLSFDDGFLDAPVAPLMTGTSHDPSIALCRALTELCQWRANMIFVRDEMPRETSRARNAALRARVLEERGIALDAARPLSAPARGEEAAEAAPTIRDRLERSARALERLGVELFLARLASVPGHIEVVKLVADGLQPLTAGVDYLDGGETESRLSRRFSRRMRRE